MDAFIRDAIKNGKNAQEILDMPYHFVLQLFEEEVEKEKPETSNSFFDLLL